MTAKVTARVHPVHLMNFDWAPGGCNPQTKPINFGCESAENWLLPSTSTVAIVIITQPVSWYSFYRPMEDGRLSWPRHCSKYVQPVPKAVYRNGCHDKHNCLRYLNLGPLTLQSDTLTTMPLWHKFCISQGSAVTFSGVAGKFIITYVKCFFEIMLSKTYSYQFIFDWVVLKI